MRRNTPGRTLVTAAAALLLGTVACEGPPPTSLEPAAPAVPAFTDMEALAIIDSPRCRFAIGYRPSQPPPFDPIPDVHGHMGVYPGLDTAWSTGGIHNWPKELHHVPVFQMGLTRYTHLVGLEGSDCGSVNVVLDTPPEGYRLRTLGSPDQPGARDKYWFQFTTRERIDEYFLDRPPVVLKLKLFDLRRRPEVLDEVHFNIDFGFAHFWWGCWYTVNPILTPKPHVACIGEDSFILW